MADTNITQDHITALRALQNGEGGFALFSCFVDGAPAAAISHITRDTNGEYVVTPLFVSVTDKMVLTDHEGAKARN